MKRDIRGEREIEKEQGIVRDPGEPAADQPSDLPEHHGVHPQDVNEFHGDAERDRARSDDDEPGPTARPRARPGVIEATRGGSRTPALRRVVGRLVGDQPGSAARLAARPTRPGNAPDPGRVLRPTKFGEDGMFDSPEHLNADGRPKLRTTHRLCRRRWRARVRGFTRARRLGQRYPRSTCERHRVARRPLGRSRQRQGL